MIVCQANCCRAPGGTTGRWRCSGFNRDFKHGVNTAVRHVKLLIGEIFHHGILIPKNPLQDFGES